MRLLLTLLIHVSVSVLDQDGNRYLWNTRQERRAILNFTDSIVEDHQASSSGRHCEDSGNDAQSTV